MRAYILAGGRGSRLSSGKGLLTVGGLPIVERVRAAAEPLAEEVVLVGDPRLLAGLGGRVITEAESVGPLAAVCAALADAHPHDALVLPWDAPFVTTPVLRALCDFRGKADAVVPRRGEYIEPLVAVYGRGCLAPAQAALDAGQRRVVSFYEAVMIRWVCEEDLAPVGLWERLFFNVNTPGDLERARKLAELDGEAQG